MAQTFANGPSVTRLTTAGEAVQEIGTVSRIETRNTQTFVDVR